MPKLEDWTILFYEAPTDKPTERSAKLAGKIYNDERFNEGEFVVTSRLLKMSFNDKTAETENTIYRLGRQAGGISPQELDKFAKLDQFGVKPMEIAP